MICTGIFSFNVSKRKMPVIRRGNKRRDMDDSGDDTGVSIIRKVLGDVSKSSATKQILLGASSGWVTGFLGMKVGKTAAMALGGGIILLQIANEKGYIKINWDKVNRNLDEVADKVEEKITGEGPTWVDKVKTFARNNTPFTSGFIGGFLIGLASH